MSLRDVQLVLPEVVRAPSDALGLLGDRLADAAALAEKIGLPMQLRLDLLELEFELQLAARLLRRHGAASRNTRM
eukprot:9301305-Pyramimonas_sp.AAC.1